MKAHIAYAEGSPCPTIVLDANLLPCEEILLSKKLRAIYSQLVELGMPDVLKFALIETSSHPLYDLQYRFVQCIPGPEVRFDFRGSCGHSILSSILAAQKMGVLPNLHPGAKVRVQVVNTGDKVVCEIDSAQRDAGGFTVHFLQPEQTQLESLLLTGRPQDVVSVGMTDYEVSLVAGSNPYVFVKAQSLGLESADALFCAGDEAFAKLTEIKRSAARLLGWPEGGAFPKVAVVGRDTQGDLYARAVSVPSWHPTLALTGIMCTAIAARLPGSVVHDLLADRDATSSAPLTIRTPGSTASVAASFIEGVSPTLGWVSVGKKNAHHLHEITVQDATAEIPTPFQRKEEACLVPSFQ